MIVAHDDAAAAGRAEVRSIEVLVEPRDVTDEHDLAARSLKAPGLALRKMRMGVNAEVGDGPSLLAVCSEKDAALGEVIEVPRLVRLRAASCQSSSTRATSAWGPAFAGACPPSFAGACPPSFAGACPPSHLAPSLRRVGVAAG